MPPITAPTDGGRPAEGGLGAPAAIPHGPGAPEVALVARLALALGLVVGGFVLEPGALPEGIRLMVWLTAAVMVALAWTRRTNRWAPPDHIVHWATAGAAAVLGAAIGSRGQAGIAVAVTLPVAWVGALDGDPIAGFGAPAAAAITGLAAGALLGVTHVGEAVAVAVVLAVAGLAGWAGRTVSDEIRLADLERAELRRIRTEMVTTVSHELRTPLTVIQGATATLSRRWDVLSEPERLDLVDVLTENVASLDASIMHFADAARLERGEVILTPEWVSVQESLSAAMGRRAAALAGHDVRPDLAVDCVWADRIALERILEHLLLNAARFSAVGLPINVRLTAGAGETTLTVSDQGQGIAPRLLATVWEPLQRGDVADTGVSRGAGLGLPIVRELARLHGGDASLSSARGRGTTVSVTFPQPAAGPASALAWPPPAREEPPPATPRRGALSPRTG